MRISDWSSDVCSFDLVGAALVKHPGVRMVSFTGGTDTGRVIGAIAGQRLIPVGLELGGKSPHIVFEDADLDRAVAGVMSGIFGSAGDRKSTRLNSSH